MRRTLPRLIEAGNMLRAVSVPRTRSAALAYRALSTSAPRLQEAHTSTSPAPSFPPPLLDALARTLQTHSDQLGDPTTRLLEKVYDLLASHPTTAGVKLPQPVEDALVSELSPRVWASEPAPPLPPLAHPARPPLARRQRASLRRFLFRLSWPPSAPPPTLPPRALRALVHLSHASRDFVLPFPERLTLSVDDALVPEHITSMARSQRANDLHTRARNRRSMPALTIPGNGLAGLESGVAQPLLENYAGAAVDFVTRMGMRGEGRLAKVREALTGVDWDDEGKAPLPRPGLPVLRDREAREGAEGHRLVSVALRGDRPLFRDEVKREEPKKVPKGSTWF